MIINWDFEPTIFTLGPLQIRWYGLLFIGAFLVGASLLKAMFKTEQRPDINLDNLLYFALFGTIIGARMVHCFIYDPTYYLSDPFAILRIWEGGLASHGGVLGFLLGLWIGNRTLKPSLPYLWLLDRATLPAALGAAFVRFGNFLNSEIVGLPTSGSWGVIFGRIDTIPRHPVQLYESLSYTFIFVALASIYRQQGSATPVGLLFGIFMISIFATRLTLEYVKTPQATYEATQLLSVGQYLSLPFILLGLVVLVRTVNNRA